MAQWKENEHQIGSGTITVDSKTSNLSCSEESKHIEMVSAVLNNRRIWQKYVKI